MAIYKQTCFNRFLWNIWYGKNQEQTLFRDGDREEMRVTASSSKQKEQRDDENNIP